MHQGLQCVSSFKGHLDLPLLYSVQIFDDRAIYLLLHTVICYICYYTVIEGGIYCLIITVTLTCWDDSAKKYGMQAIIIPSSIAALTLVSMQSHR